MDFDLIGCLADFFRKGSVHLLRKCHLRWPPFLAVRVSGFLVLHGQLRLLGVKILALKQTLVTGAIIEGNGRCYTHLKEIFSIIKNVQINYNWLITDRDCGSCGIDDYGRRSNKHKHGYRYYEWISGEELTSIVEADDAQWVWAVFSGFHKSIPLEKILQYDFPYSNGYAGFWKNPITIQHPLADIELVAWDSSLTLLISNNIGIVSDFRRAFSFSEDLAEHNSKYS
jgi:hypothetical protein